MTRSSDVVDDDDDGDDDAEKEEEVGAERVVEESEMEDGSAVGPLVGESE